jgi:hypothetical protein
MARVTSSNTPTLVSQSTVGSKKKHIAERLRQARSLVSMSRIDFCIKHDLNPDTIQSWELGRTMIRDANATKFCEALAQEDIFCSENWLIEGVGPPPSRLSSEIETLYSPQLFVRWLKSKSSNPLISMVQDEAIFFQQNCQEKGLDPIIINLIDKAMNPDYGEKEYIGAIRIAPEQIDTLNQGICLIETKPDYFLVRKLLIEKDKYILIPSNTNYPILYLDSIVSVGEIIWRRKVPHTISKKNKKRDK